MLRVSVAVLESGVLRKPLLAALALSPSLILNSHGRFGTDRFGGVWLGKAGKVLNKINMKKKETKQEVKYEFTVERLYKDITAEQAATELQRIKEKYGTLEPSDVVAESEDEDSVLHGIFCWDDTEAAKKWRAEQARQLIKSIKIVVVNKKVEAVTRAFVNVRSTDFPQRTYIPIQEAVLDDTAYNDLLKQSKDDMQSFVDKYAQVEELNNVKAEMLKAIALI